MNPYPFTIEESSALEKRHLDKPACKIFVDNHEPKELVRISYQKCKILLKIHPERNEFFFQRKYLNRMGLDDVNNTWHDACLPKSFAELHVELNQQMRTTLSLGNAYYQSHDWMDHTIYGFETTVLYAQSGIKNAKIIFLEEIRKELKRKFPKTKIECDWMPSRSNAQNELLLHVESVALQEIPFEESLGLYFKSLQNQLDALVGTEVLTLRKSKGNSRIEVLVHDGLLLSDDFTNHHKFKDGEKVFEITEHGVSVGVQCNGNVPGEPYQSFSVYSEINGTRKKILDTLFSPFSGFSSFAFESCISNLEQYYYQHFNQKWNRLTYVSLKSPEMGAFNADKFNLDFLNEFQDIFDMSIMTHEVSEEGHKAVSLLLVVNDERILTDTDLMIRINKTIQSLIYNSFK